MHANHELLKFWQSDFALGPEVTYNHAWCCEINADKQAFTASQHDVPKIFQDVEALTSFTEQGAAFCVLKQDKVFVDWVK